MKKLIIATLIVMGFTLSQNSQAQVRISINIGSQPTWGPTGYDYARYYYLPEYNAYYDVVNSRFYYLNRRTWVSANTLPASFGRVNLYNTYKVVVNRNYVPYRDNRNDIIAYGKFKNVHNQNVIRDSHDVRYRQNNSHSKNNGWTKVHPSNSRRGDARNNGRSRR